jgi:hypothetical protein
VRAAYGNHIEVAGLLLAAHADVNLADDTRQSAYLIATSEVGDDPRLLELTLTPVPTSTPGTASTAPA